MTPQHRNTEALKHRIQSPFPLTQRLRRLAWNCAWALLFRPSPRICFAWRAALLRLFGARVDRSARVYNSARVWAPWNLRMGARSILAEEVDCYNVAPVLLGEGAIVSQGAYLCTASHDIRDPSFRLVTAPIELGCGAWVCARAIVSMGITVGDGAVVALGGVVVKDVAPGTVVGGNPALVIGIREA